LTDVDVSFSGVEVTDVYPKHIPDVFSETPIVIHGRYENPMQGSVRIDGVSGGERWSKSMDVRLSADSGNKVVQSLWARAKIEDLQAQSYRSMIDRGEGDPITGKIVDLALEFSLMSQYTSFVAVEPRVVNVGGKQYTVRVPIEMADGVQYDNENISKRGRIQFAAPMAVAKSLSVGVRNLPQTRKGALNGFAGDALERREVRTPEQIATANYELKVRSSLRRASGRIAVMVWLSDLDPKTLTELKAAGLSVSVEDSNLVVVFGTISASKLRTLAQIASVQSVEPLQA
jgi:Ca-activated chloride channel family protein